MKTHKDIYRLPLRKFGGTWVYDEANNFVFQFEPKYEKGKYAKGWKDFENKVLTKINGGSGVFQGVFSNEDGFIKYNDNHVISIRGWGNLTGKGGHNLPPEEAANIQDTFAQFIVEQLNKR